MIIISHLWAIIILRLICLSSCDQYILVANNKLNGCQKNKSGLFVRERPKNRKITSAKILHSEHCDENL